MDVLLRTFLRLVGTYVSIAATFCHWFMMLVLTFNVYNMYSYIIVVDLRTLFSVCSIVGSACYFSNGHLYNWLATSDVMLLDTCYGTVLFPLSATEQ